MSKNAAFGSFDMNHVDRIVKGLRREALIVTWVAVLLLAFISVGLMAASGPGSSTDWSVVRLWALFMIGLFAYGRVMRKVAQLAEALSAPK
jgi:peptidoglycan/LPS O-acetylase OafA/YrhL